MSNGWTYSTSVDLPEPPDKGPCSCGGYPSIFMDQQWVCWSCFKRQVTKNEGETS